MKRIIEEKKLGLGIAEFEADLNASMREKGRV